MRKINLLLFLVMFLLLISCNKEEEEIYNNSLKFSETIKPEIAFPNQIGKEMSFIMKNDKIFYYSKINDFDVYEGDILVSKGLLNFLKKEDSTNISSSNKSAKSISALSKKWINSTVNYNISLTNRREDILWAINHIELNTNIKFNESASGNYIDFVESEGCSSYVGMTGGRQFINLADGCVRGSIVHEICHALGVFHEQSRPDRDNHIIINWENIQSGMSHNFNTEIAHSYGNFDFESIMMYSPWAFSSNGSPTIVKKDGTVFLTQRSGLSITDINGLKDMYPGPNMIKKLENLSEIIDVGANNSSDVVYLKKERYSTDLYLNNKLSKKYTNNEVHCVDITSNGLILTNLSGYNTTNKYPYNTVDISEGGGNIYCLSKSIYQTNLYKKNNNDWLMIASNIQGIKVTVDLIGRPWVITEYAMYLYQDNGSSTKIDRPVYFSEYDRLIDIGSAGNSIYVSMKNVKQGNIQLLKYSNYANQLIRQPGEALNLDGHANGVVWTN